MNANYTNPDKELQAYIYQQVSELEPFLVPNTQVNVLVQNETKEKSVRLSANVPEGVIEAEAAGEDLYAAISDAKKVLLYQIDEINNATDSIERDMKVRNATNGSQWLH